MGLEYDLETSDQHVTVQRYELADVGDESQALRHVVAQGELPAHDMYFVYVRVGDMLLEISYLNYGPDRTQPSRQYLDQLVETATSRAEAALASASPP